MSIGSLGMGVGAWVWCFCLRSYRRVQAGKGQWMINLLIFGIHIGVEIITIFVN
jgi:hypothetical protein